MCKIRTILQGIYNNYYYKVDEYLNQPIKYYQVFLELPENTSLIKIKQEKQFKNLLKDIDLKESLQNIQSTPNNDFQLKCLTWSSTDMEHLSVLTDIIFKIVDFIYLNNKGV